MNLEFINQILNVVSVSGINQVVFSVKEDNTLIVSGIDKDGTVVVFHTFENNGRLDKSLGVHRISIFMDRLKLFALNKIQIEQVDKNYFIKSLILKEGRKKISCLFAEPTTISYPKAIVVDEVVHRFSIDKKMYESIYRASQTINSNGFYIYTDKNQLIFRVVDETTGDEFEDTIGQAIDNTDLSFKWSADKFFKLVGHNLKTSDKTEINIGMHGHLSMNVSGVDFLLLPLFVE